MKYLTLLFVATVLACGPSKKEQLQSLKDEVIAIHDEVMPRMGELRKTRKALEAKAETLVATDSSQAIMLITLASDIANANEGMMQWMRQFEPEFDGTKKEIKEYLEGQKEAIERVRKDMNSTLEKGKEALGE